MMLQNLQIHVRNNENRGGADKGWLKTFHSFSTDVYPQEEYPSWGALKVLNEDRVEPYKGFGEHGHKEFEIFSYIVSGELEHQDSMGNIEILKRGDIQLTSAGTGIRHSEKAYGNTQGKTVWTTPSVSGLTPKYFTRHFTNNEKVNKWARIVAPATGSVDVSEDRAGVGHAPVCSSSAFGVLHGLVVYHDLLTLLRKKVVMLAGVPASVERKAYIHIVQTSGYNAGKRGGVQVKVGAEIELREGDGAMVTGPPLAEIVISNVGDGVAEILLFEVD